MGVSAHRLLESLTVPPKSWNALKSLTLEETRDAAAELLRLRTMLCQSCGKKLDEKEKE